MGKWDGIISGQWETKEGGREIFYGQTVRFRRRSWKKGRYERFRMYPVRVVGGVPVPPRLHYVEILEE